MDISSVNSDLIRGNVTTIILNSLYSGDRYGYDILKEIEQKSNGQYNLKQPTMYSVLKRLEKQGLIESYLGELDDTGGGRRRYYKLTQEGSKYLEKEKTEYEFSRTILDNLVSDTKFDLESGKAPFNVNELRPYTKTKDDDEDKSKPAKPIIREKLIFKYIDKTTGEVIDPKDLNSIINAAKERKVQAANQQTILNISNQQTLQNRDISQPQIIENPAIQNYLNGQSQTDLSQIKNESQEQNLTNAINTENKDAAFTNRNVTFEEDKMFHPLSPHKTLHEVFNDIEKRDDTKTATEPKVIEKRRISILDILAQKEEESENLKRIAAEREEQLKNVEDSKIKEESAISSQKVEQIKKDDEFVPSYVLFNKKTEFEFEKQKIDYKNILGGLAEKHADLKEQHAPEFAPFPNTELKTRLYSKGFKVKPYTKANTSEYYSFNFVLSNRLNRDSLLLVLASYVAMIAIMWAATAGKVSYVVFLTFLSIGIALYAIPFSFYLLNPSKRKRANFNFKLSVLNRTMLFIELTIIVMLIGFFLIGADIHNVESMIAPIIIPTVLLLNLPLSSIIYYTLYRTRKYHIA